MNQIIEAFQNDIKNCIHTNLTPDILAKCYINIQARKTHPFFKEDKYNKQHSDDQDYSEIVHQGVEARNQIVQCQIHLVYHIAKFFQDLGLPLGDLITIG